MRLAMDKSVKDVVSPVFEPSALSAFPLLDLYDTSVVPHQK